MDGVERPEVAASPVSAASGDEPVVLVVGDEAIVRAETARVLTLAGMVVAVAANGRDALRLIVDGRVRPTVVVTDIEMPGMTGVELAARVLALRPTIRIVMMTADTVRAATARRHPSIVDAVLVKPFRPATLVAAVRPRSDRLAVP
ncbi:MAG: hypothetical protein NVS9B8_07300 [Candidatus Limnocylindrales bacterium]